MRLDSVRRIETPEGVELTLPVAGPYIRARARLIDVGIKWIVMMILTFVLSLFGQVGTGLLLLAAFLSTWFYSAAFEAIEGATPGKKAAGLRVVHDDGTPIGWPAAIVRSLVGFADMLPIGFVVGWVTCHMNEDFKRLGDLAAGTVVVYSGRQKSETLVLEKGQIPTPPRVQLTIDEQRALVEFADRAATLTVARQNELALIPKHLVYDEKDPSDKLIRHAAWIAGKR